MAIQIFRGIVGAKTKIVSILGPAKFTLMYIIFFLILSTEVCGTSVSSKIKIIPKDEREYLEYFFKRTIASDTFGFVLFGDKPIALTIFTRTEAMSEYEKKTYPLSIFAYVNAEHGNFCKGYAVWKKHQKLFPSKRYVFLEHHSPMHQETVYIFLINKKALIDTVQKYLADFKQVIGNHITPHLLLKEMTQTNDIFKTLKHNNLLIGLLFGYGRHNAELFQKRNEFIKRFPNKRKECPIRLQMFNNHELALNVLALDLPHFVADLDHSETQQLKQKYLQQRREILKSYKSRDFLEVTLNQFVSEFTL